MPSAESCQSCKTSKVKCSKYRPKCDRCELRGLSCIYPEGSSRSKRSESSDISDGSRKVTSSTVFTNITNTANSGGGSVSQYPYELRSRHYYRDYVLETFNSGKQREERAVAEELKTSEVDGDDTDIDLETCMAILPDPPVAHLLAQQLPPDIFSADLNKIFGEEGEKDKRIL